MATSRLLGRTTASTGAIEEISVGSGLSLSGGTLSASGGSSATYLSRPMFPALNNTMTTSTLNTNTTIRTGMFFLPYSITVNQIQLRVATATTP